MRQFITSTEACGLLDRLLSTVQNLNQTRMELFGKDIEEVPMVESRCEEAWAPLETIIPPMFEEPARLPKMERPVLTIPLGDLLREGAAARERRGQHNPRPQRPVARPSRPRQPPRTNPPLRELRTIEVLYKRQRMAS